MKDYYEILEVHPKASLEVIKKAYRVLAAKYHPDTSCLGKEEATRRMAELNEAYIVLSDDKKRRDYDLRYRKDNSQYQSSNSKQSESQHGAENTSSSNSYSMSVELAKGRFFACCEKYLFKIRNRKIVDATDSLSNLISCKKLQNEFFVEIKDDYNLLLQADLLNGHLAHIYMVALFSVCEEFIKWNGYSDANKVLKVAFNHKNCDSDIEKRYAELYRKVSRYSIKHQSEKGDNIKRQVKESIVSNKNFIIKRFFIFILIILVAISICYCITKIFSFDRMKNGETNQTYVLDQNEIKNFGNKKNVKQKGQKNPFDEFEEYIKITDKQRSQSKFGSVLCVTGYDKLHGVYNASGHCELTIDNSQYDTDVYLRVWDITGTPRPVRAIYIKGKESFTMYNFDGGTYELRYKVMSKDGTSYGCRSQSFNLVDNSDGYSVMKITLYTVKNGNFHTYHINIDDI